MATNVNNLHVAILIAVIIHIKVIVVLDEAVFDGCKDHSFRLIKLQVLCCWHMDEYNVLNLSGKHFEFEFGFPPRLVCKLVHV